MFLFAFSAIQFSCVPFFPLLRCDTLLPCVRAYDRRGEKGGGMNRTSFALQ